MFQNTTQIIKRQITLLTISDGKTWNYFAVTQLYASFGVITSENNVDIYCLICLHSFKTKVRLKSHENVCKNHNFLDAAMADKKIIY